MTIVLAVDQGTTNTKVVALDESGRVAARHSERVDINYPRPGWVESDAGSIWQTVRTCIELVVDQVDGDEIAAIGVSNQRETITAWDPSNGEVLGPAISWQCTRGAPFCRSISSPRTERLVSDTTGLPLDPMFSASKMRWLLDSIPDAHHRASEGRLTIGTIDAWLGWNLTGGKVIATDITNASRTALYDLSTGTWSDDLIDLFGIPQNALPEIAPSSHPFGSCVVPCIADVPLGALIGDSHASLIGHGAFEPGSVKASFGTGTSVMAPIEDLAARPIGLALTIGWSAELGDTIHVVRAVEGNIYATGAALEWTADLLGITIDELDQLAASCSESDGVAFVPAFSGLGAPHWDPTARGAIFGLTRGSGGAQIARATFDAVAHQVADVIDAIPPQAAPAVLHADGGAMRSDVLASAVADLTGMTVRVSGAEVAAAGAAMLAGLSAGVWSGVDELASLERTTTDVDAALSVTQRESRREQWTKAVSRISGWKT